MKQIPLTQGQFALVDNKDYEFLKEYKWYAAKRGYTFYVQRTVNDRALHMHRMIMNPTEDQEVDHKDGNGLNNQRGNLRSVTRTQNQWNRGRQKNNLSGYKGVGYNKLYKIWRVRIKVRGKTLHIGSFKEKIDAAKAYNEAATKYHGEFALLNKI